MNKSATAFIRLIALAMLILTSLSIISCDKFPLDLDSIFQNNDKGANEVPQCPHTKVVNGRCSACKEIFTTAIKDLNLDASGGTTLPDGTISTQFYHVKATVKQVFNDDKGEMLISDSTGFIKVKSIYTEDDTPYGEMTEKPDECDEVLLRCLVEKVGGKWQIRTATIVEFKAVQNTVNYLTVAEALELCGESGNLTTERYYIRGIVKTVTKPEYGAMVIADETGEISVYGTYSADGAIGYADMAEKPVKGDEVLLYCTLQNYNGNKEIKSAWLIEFTHNEPNININDYKTMNIADARDSVVGSLVKVSGVVARITYSTGQIPSGIILVDGTSSIYVYDGDIAGQVQIGNTVEIAGEKTYWILSDEISNANKFGYKGANQLDNAILLSNDKGNTAFDKSWIQETTVKELMETPITEDITSLIFKATAYIQKSPASNFVNYYIDDLDALDDHDGVTGTYVYTQCNGSDFAWMDKFDGKVCTVYFVALNAKSTSTGCNWRFLPVEIIDEDFSFNTDKAAEFAVVYHGLGQFMSTYTGNPETQLLTSISAKELGFEGATLSYSSSNESVARFTTTDGKTIFNCGDEGKATITVIGSYNGITYSESLEITVKSNKDIDYVSVKEAINASNGSTVTVKGIIGPSLINQVGFYLIDSTGAIAVNISTDKFDGLEIGHQVILTGTRAVTKDGGGQICIQDAEIVANEYGKHDYSTDSFIKDKTIDEIKSVKDSAEATTQIYVVTATVEKVTAQYGSYTSVTFNVGGLMLYTSSASQYSWVEEFFASGESKATLTVELALCDWNSKGLKGCILSVDTEDGKVYNTANFDIY